MSLPVKHIEIFKLRVMDKEKNPTNFLKKLMTLYNIYYYKNNYIHN